VIATAIFFYCHITFRAFLGVSSNPVGRFRVVIALLDPALEQRASHWVVPVLAALEAECVHALACDGSRLHVLHLDGVVAVWARTPPQQPVALYEAVGDEVLVLELDLGVLQ